MAIHEIGIERLTKSILVVMWTFVIKPWPPMILWCLLLPVHLVKYRFGTMEYLFSMLRLKRTLQKLRAWSWSKLLSYTSTLHLAMGFIVIVIISKLFCCSLTQFPLVQQHSIYHIQCFYQIHEYGIYHVPANILLMNVYNDTVSINNDIKFTISKP